MRGDEGWCKVDRSPIALDRLLFCDWESCIPGERSGHLRRDGVEQRLNQELSFPYATRRGEAIKRRKVLFGVVSLLWVIIRVFYEFQLAKEPSTVETGVG